MSDFIANLTSIPTLSKVCMSEHDILKAVLDDCLFGAVQCDITVPEELHQYFEDMAPIFKHATIDFEDIGEHMQEHMKSRPERSRKPRKARIGSLHGERIRLATPLLKWYLEHGLVVTKVYQTFEWRKSPNCFQSFVKRVADARRSGDADPSKAIFADLFKLLGELL
jgi:hypothetical protein